jgi:hypothetical protein
MHEMLERFTIDAHDALPYHLPQVLGFFEPVTAVMFLNVDDEQFDRWRRAIDSEPQLNETFWHEAYHCFQSFATGYCYARCVRLSRAFGDSVRIAAYMSVAWRVGVAAALDSFFSLVSWPLSRPAREMLAHARRLRANAAYVEWVTRRARQHDQPSIWGAIHPALHASLRAADLPFRERGPAGISAQDIVEGSAFLYGREVRSTHDRPSTPQVDPTLDESGPYQRLISASLAQNPQCTNRGIRVAAALALRYEVPGEAYLPLLERVCKAAPTDEAEAARDIAVALPQLPGAGAILGAARQYQARYPTGYRIYDEPLAQLEQQAWGIDELDLLAGPQALDAIPPGQLGFTVTTRTTIRRSNQANKGPASVLIASMLLPTGPSVAKLRREFRMGLPV